MLASRTGLAAHLDIVAGKPDQKTGQWGVSLLS